MSTDGRSIGAKTFGYFSLTLGLAAGLALAQGPAQPFIRHTFEENDGGWQVMGSGGKVSRTSQPADAHEGKAALAYDYKVEKGTMGVLMLPAPAGDLAKARAFRFWIKTDYSAPVVVALQEKDNGGRYLSMFTSPAGKWQQVELSPGDFFLSEDANDPKDPNNKLDLDQVEGVGILDVMQMLVQGEGAIVDILGVKAGDHKLLIDDFTVSAEPLPASAAGSDVTLDPGTRPQVSWFGLGVQSISRATRDVLKDGGIQVDYHGAPGRAAGFMRPIPRGRLAGTEQIAFMCAAAKPAKIVVQLEEKGGGKYNTMIEIPAGKTPKEYTVRYSELIQADDSKDANGKLDLADVKQILFMDLLAWFEMTERDNTLWIGGLKAGK